MKKSEENKLVDTLIKLHEHFYADGEKERAHGVEMSLYYFGFFGNKKAKEFSEMKSEERYI
jgi:hypothetical protein